MSSYCINTIKTALKCRPKIDYELKRGYIPEVVSFFNFKRFVSQAPNISFCGLYTEEEVDAVAQHTILTIVTQGEQITVDDTGNKLIKIANKVDVNLKDLDINLIAGINPFQRAYEVVSKSLTPETLRTIQYVIEDKRSEHLTDEEAILLFTKYLPKWREENPGKDKPEITDGDPTARRIAMAIEHLRNLKRRKLAQQQ